MNKKKILIVDDEEAVRISLARGLQAHGYETVLAANQSEAVHKARHEKPDLIILDVMLGDEDGAEVSNILSEEHKTKDIPIIFLTGLKTHAEEKAEEEEGGRLILAKPISLKHLLEKIEEIL